MKKYPTPWQRKMMWASLSAFFVVVLFLIVGTVVYLSANLIAFLQPILIPVAIAAILAYLLDPVVTHLAARGFGRTKAVLTIFAIAFLGIVALCAWIVPLISVQSASLARKLPAFTEQTRDRVVDLIYRYEHTFGLSSEGSATGLINWLLAGPTPVPAPSATPKAAPSPPSASGEVIASRTGQTDLRRSAANPGLGAKATARDRETTARSHCQALVTVQDQHWRLPRRHRISP